jgi:uncharacterized membrane protein
MKKLIHFENILVIIFASGLTKACLAQWLMYPGKAFQIVGTFMMFIAMFIWMLTEDKRGGKRNAHG